MKKYMTPELSKLFMLEDILVLSQEDNLYEDIYDDNYDEESEGFGLLIAD